MPDVRPAKSIQEAQDAAAAAAQGPRSYPHDANQAWNIEDVTVYQQVTSA